MLHGTTGRLWTAHSPTPVAQKCHKAMAPPSVRQHTLLRVAQMLVNLTPSRTVPLITLQPRRLLHQTHKLLPFRLPFFQRPQTDLHPQQPSRGDFVSMPPRISPPPEPLPPIRRRSPQIQHHY